MIGEEKRKHRYLLEKIMNEIKVPVEVLNAILGYLGTRPYQEVFVHIQALQDIAKGQLNPTEPSTTVED